MNSSSPKLNDPQSIINDLRLQLAEARSTLDGITKGEVDALIVQGKNGPEIFTLQSADHTYRVFIETMSEGAITLDSEGVIVYCNSSFANMISENLTGSVGEPLKSFVPAKDHAKLDELIRDGWEGDSKGELLLKGNAGTIPVQLSITKLSMQSGKTISIIVTNLTDQKEALRQQKIKAEQLATMNTALELSNHDLQQFASVASHDLQEPLRKIQIFSNILQEKFGPDLPEVAKEHIHKIVSSAARMKTLIVDVLNYSRLSSNDNSFEKTDLTGLVNELLEDLEMTIQEKEASIHVNALPEIEINPGQMRQVFQNLLSNALKFSQKNVKPMIEVWSVTELTEFPLANKIPQPYVHIHVKDNGIGFNEKYIKNIFNLFEKLHSKDVYDGTGIGLAITKKIVEKHNGYINVRSQEGAGTEFIISLPVHQ